MKLIVGNSLPAAALLNGNIDKLPDGASASWTTSDANIATVAQDASNPLRATVTGVAPGTVTVTCSVNDHTNGVTTTQGSATQDVEAAPVPVTSVSVTVG